MYNRILIIFLLCCLSTWTNAQTFKIPVSKDVNELEIIISNSQLAIVGYDGNEISITSKNKMKADPRAEGLTTLYQNAEDNTGLGINLEQKNEKIRLIKTSKREEAIFSMKIPKNLRLVVREEEWQGEHITIINMTEAITVLSNNSDISLENVVGPVNVNTTSGDISGNFSNHTKIHQSNIASVSGTVDISLPENLQVDLDISSISGEIYSDFQLQYKNRQLHRGLEKIGVGRKTKASINGGGIKLVLSSISDDVYLRKIVEN